MSARLILVERVRPKLSQQDVQIAFWQIIWQIFSMKLTAVIYPDAETDWLVAECPEIGTASQGKTAQAPVIKSEQTKQVKPSVLNANARMGRHHHGHFSHHRFHKRMGALKTHQFSNKVTSKHVTPATKRG